MGEGDACLARISIPTGTRCCLGSGGFAHRCGRGMLPSRCRGRLALGGFAHGRGRRMLGECSLLRRGWMAGCLPTYVFGGCRLTLRRLTHGGGRRMLIGRNPG